MVVLTGRPLFLMSRKENVISMNQSWQLTRNKRAIAASGKKIKQLDSDDQV
jgi:hypothetical protein